MNASTIRKGYLVDGAAAAIRYQGVNPTKTARSQSDVQESKRKKARYVPWLPSVPCPFKSRYDCDLPGSQM